MTLTNEILSAKGKNYHFKNWQYDPITDMHMPFGNGCWRHNNCFTCKYDDCVDNTISGGKRGQDLTKKK